MGMRKISSSSTFWYKKVFPVIWFGFLLVFLVTGLLSGVAPEDPIFLIMPCVMAAFGFILMRKLVFDLADEVYDGGQFLLVKKKGTEQRISLSNIKNVNASTMINPPRITLSLVTPGEFGPEVSFCPVSSISLNPFRKNEVAENLIDRVDRARRERVA